MLTQTDPVTKSTCSTRQNGRYISNLRDTSREGGREGERKGERGRERGRGRERERE